MPAIESRGQLQLRGAHDVCTANKKPARRWRANANANRKGTSMDAFTKKCIVTVLGSAALAQFTAGVNEQYQIRAELRHQRGDRTEALILEWSEKRPNAELAAQFFFIDESRPPSRRRRARANAQQIQFFEAHFFSTVDFFRRAGDDIAQRRVNAGELSNYLGADARRWLPQLRAQCGKWEGVREMQIAQAIAALEAITGERDGYVPPSDWQALEIVGESEFVGHRPGEVTTAVRVHNPNFVSSPVAAFCALAYVSGGASQSWVRWPNNVDCIPPMQTVIVTINTPFSDTVRPADVRFALAREHYEEQCNDHLGRI